MGVQQPQCVEQAVVDASTGLWMWVGGWASDARERMGQGRRSVWSVGVGLNSLCDQVRGYTHASSSAGAIGVQS